MVITVEIQMALLTQSRQVLFPDVVQIFFAPRLAVGLCDSQVSDGQHNDRSGDRVRLKVLSPTPFAVILRALEADPAADSVPIGWIQTIVNRHITPSPWVDRRRDSVEGWTAPG